MKIGQVKLPSLTFPFTSVRLITFGLQLVGFLEFQMVYLVKELGKIALQVLIFLSVIEVSFSFFFFFSEELSVA